MGKKKFQFDSAHLGIIFIVVLLIFGGALYYIFAAYNKNADAFNLTGMSLSPASEALFKQGFTDAITEFKTTADTQAVTAVDPDKNIVFSITPTDRQTGLTYANGKIKGRKELGNLINKLCHPPKGFVSTFICSILDAWYKAHVPFPLPTATPAIVPTVAPEPNPVITPSPTPDWHECTDVSKFKSVDACRACCNSRTNAADGFQYTCNTMCRQNYASGDYENVTP